MDEEHDNGGSGNVLHVRVRLIRESARSLKASATIDLMRKARLVLPDDWPDLPRRLPRDLLLDMDQSALGLNMDILLGHTLDNAIKATFEDLTGVNLDGEEGPEDEAADGPEPPPLGADEDHPVMDPEELGLEEVVMEPDELGLEEVKETGED